MRLTETGPEPATVGPIRTAARFKKSSLKFWRTELAPEPNRVLELDQNRVLLGTSGSDPNRQGHLPEPLLQRVIEDPSGPVLEVLSGQFCRISFTKTPTRWRSVSFWVRTKVQNLLDASSQLMTEFYSIGRPGFWFCYVFSHFLLFQSPRFRLPEPFLLTRTI